MSHPVVERVTSPPRRTSINSEPRFSTHARKRPFGDQHTLVTQYDLQGETLSHVKQYICTVHKVQKHTKMVSPQGGKLFCINLNSKGNNKIY